MGEWGSGPERAEDPADVYFRDHQQLQDEFHFSAALWTWHESCGDPHKAGDARAGRIPSVWGEFEVDCRTNTIVGTRDALLDQLTRAYVRAAPGELVASTYNPTTGTFRASGRNAPEGAQLWTWYPPGQAPPDAVTFAGLRDVRVRVAARRWLPHHGHDDRCLVASRRIGALNRFRRPPNRPNAYV